MASLNALILAAFAFVVATETTSLSKESLTIVEKVSTILENVQETERNEFLRYHLQRGRELLLKKLGAKYPSFEYELSEDESILLYKYFATNNLVEEEEVIGVASNIICWGSNCIDFSDPGVHP